MSALAKVLKLAQSLSIDDQKRLLLELKKRVNRTSDLYESKTKSSDNDKEQRPYAGLLTLAGAFFSDVDNVSSNKYNHLAEIYGDRHQYE
jgi:hypothetical protein